MLRMDKLKNMGLNVYYVWEYDFKEWEKSIIKPKLETIVKKM
jgi:hypothetical protein